MAKSVFCLADSDAQAERIVDSLKAANFSNNDISVLFPDKSGNKDFAHEQHTKAPEGAATGAGTGGVVGGVLGWLIGIGSLAIPGVGPFIAAGSNRSGSGWRGRRGRGPYGRSSGHGNPRIRSQEIRR